MILQKGNKEQLIHDNLLIVAEKESDLNILGIFSEDELQFIKKSIELKKYMVTINHYRRFVFICIPKDSKDANQIAEDLRRKAEKVQKKINNEKKETIAVLDISDDKSRLLPLIEGLAISNYQYLKYITSADEKRNTLNLISVISETVVDEELKEIDILSEALSFTKNLVNEPAEKMDSLALARAIKECSKSSGFSLKILDREDIAKLGMGGLLAVNKGSLEPPVFMILEYKPDKALNNEPYVLVGKGVTYDTGGHSLKKTQDSMDYMKCDMAGAGAVAGLFKAVSERKLPIYLLGLIPATDNRISAAAYSPGDIIKMYNGKTVEVMNTDAEGRLILADALSYSNQYKPKAVFTIATLTGSASVAIGTFALVAMGNADASEMNELKVAGEYTSEKIAEFPFWDEYFESLKSDVADMKNIGNGNAGAIVGGKFLEKFTDYPFIHLDIAGPAFIKRQDSYRGIGATGVGVRLLYHYFKNKCK